MIKQIQLLLPILLAIFLTGCQEHDSKVYGTLERTRILLTATQTEIITKIFVEEGETVKKGTPLLQLDDADLKLNVAKEKANLNDKKATLTKLQNGARSEDVAAARARLLSAESEYTFQQKSLERTKRLVAEGTQSKASLDQATSQYDGASAKYNDAREQLLKLTNGSRPEDIMQAAALVDAAKASVALAENKLAKLTITATRNGQIEALPWNVGERITTGSAAVILLSDSVPFVRAYIPENKRTSLKEGSKVQVQIDGYKESVAGSVQRIAAQPSFTPYYGLNADDRSRLMYLCEIKLSTENKSLPAGLPVEIIL